MDFNSDIALAKYIQNFTANVPYTSEADEAVYISSVLQNLACIPRERLERAFQIAIDDRRMLRENLSVDPNCSEGEWREIINQLSLLEEVFDHARGLKRSAAQSSRNERDGYSRKDCNLHEAGHIIIGELLGVSFPGLRVGDGKGDGEEEASSREWQTECKSRKHFKKAYQHLVDIAAPASAFQKLTICVYAGKAAERRAHHLKCARTNISLADYTDARDIILRNNLDLRVPEFFAAQEELERRALIMVSDHAEQINALATLLHRHDNITRKDIESVMKFGDRYLARWHGEGRMRPRTPAQN